VHQVVPKDFGSQNFSFLALKAEPVGEVPILRTATARWFVCVFYYVSEAKLMGNCTTVRQRHVTDGFFYRLNHVIYS
jgi:hypothetical protein